MSIIIRAKKDHLVYDGSGNKIPEIATSYNFQPVIFTHLKNGDIELLEKVEQKQVDKQPEKQKLVLKDNKE